MFRNLVVLLIKNLFKRHIIHSRFSNLHSLLCIAFFQVINFILKVLNFFSSFAKLRVLAENQPLLVEFPQ